MLWAFLNRLDNFKIKYYERGDLVIQYIMLGIVYDLLRRTIMYSINDTVLYGANGVCRISDICSKEFSGVSKEYYILRPVRNESLTIFVPVNNRILTDKIKRILSKEEICGLIGAISTEPISRIEDDAKRKEHYRRVLSSGDRGEILKMLRELYIHKQEQLSKGKKLHISDEQFMKEGERLLYSEFSLVLNIKEDEVPGFIAERIHSSVCC